MSDSDLYREGSTIRASNVNRENAELASRYKTDLERQGIKDVINRTLEAKARQDQDVNDMQWRKDFEGYSKVVDENDNALQLQADRRAAEQGAPLSTSARAEASRNWRPEPSLLDMVSDRLGKAFNWQPSNTAGAENFDGPNKELRIQQQEEFNRQESETSGLNELKQRLNNQ